MTITDDGKCDPDHIGRFISLRSNYLFVCCNKVIILEPYSPHCFGKQFGFCQHVSGVLKEDIRTRDLETLAKFCKFTSYYKTQCKLVCPGQRSNIDDHVTEEFKVWWSKVHDDDYLEKFIEKLISSPQGKGSSKRKLPNTDHGKAKIAVVENTISKENATPPYQNCVEKVAISLEESHGEVDPDLCWKRKRNRPQVFHPTDFPSLLDVPSCETLPESLDRLFQDQRLNEEVSRAALPGTSEASISNPHRSGDTTTIVDDGVVSQPAYNLPVERSPSTAKDATKHVANNPPAFPEPSEFNADRFYKEGQFRLAEAWWHNIKSKLARTPFNQIFLFDGEIRKLLGRIEDIEVVDSSSLQDMVKGLLSQAKHLSSVESSFSSNLTEEEQIERLAPLKARLKDADISEKTIAKEMQSLEQRMDELQSFLQRSRAESSKIREEIAFIESTPTLSKKEADSLDALRESLKSSLEELKDLNWKP